MDSIFVVKTGNMPPPAPFRYEKIVEFTPELEGQIIERIESKEGKLNLEGKHLVSETLKYVRDLVSEGDASPTEDENSKEGERR